MEIIDKLMKIIVVGCGKIGRTILEGLVAEGHDLVAVDSDPDVINSITNISDVIGVCGNGADCLVLREAGIESADMFIASSGSDELNMLSCFIAGKMGNVKTIARIRNPEYNEKSLGFLKQHLGLSMSINPEFFAAKELFDILKLPSAVKIESFARRAFEMIELILKENSEMCGVTLSELRDKLDAKFLICVVQREDEVYIPDGNFSLRAGDKIGLTATPAEIIKLLRKIGVLRKKSKNVMILGGSRTAYYLAKMLGTIGTSVKIIEQDKNVCKELCDKLPNTTIINGDGAQQELLLEEGIRSMDAVVSLTGIDEENILFSFFASSQNVPKVISKVNKQELESIAGKLGLDCIISPKRTITDFIVRYARALENSNGSNVETLYKLMDGRAEAVEFIANNEPRVTGIPLRVLKLKRNILISVIIRDRKPIIPTGEDIILPGDHIVVIAAGRRLQDLTDIIA